MKKIAILLIVIIGAYLYYDFITNVKTYEITINYCDCRESKIERINSYYKPTNAHIVTSRLTVPIIEIGHIRELNVCGIKSKLIQ